MPSFMTRPVYSGVPEKFIEVVGCGQISEELCMPVQETYFYFLATYGQLGANEVF